MLNLDIIRRRCRELLIQAELENNQKKRKRLLECYRRFQEDDCFSNPQKRKDNYFLLFMGLDFSMDEAYDYCEYMENASAAPGVLLPIRWNGKEKMEGKPVEAILNPAVENYYQFESGTIFKIRNGTQYYRLNSDGEWFYDGSLQRRCEDAAYRFWRIGYRILENNEEHKESL